MNTPTHLQETPVTTSTVPRHRPETTLPAIDVSRLPGQPFGRLVGVELRKSVDTRSGRWVLAALLALSVVALGWSVAHASDQPVALLTFVQTALTPVGLLLPVVGILAMTAEWSQRTALTTFTLSPRRVPVLLAKLVASVFLALAVIALVAVLSVAATALAGAFSDAPVDWSFGWREGVGMVTYPGLNVVMGAGFGALLPVTGVAITAFFLAPPLFNMLASAVLKGAADWFDVFGAFDRLASLQMDGKTAESLTAVTVWVVLPTVLGLWLSARREVK
jgi:ABC-type transport system involved in multi-copper enzyme maturation permease subunit